MTPMDDLIARLEGGEGADLWLDREVALRFEQGWDYSADWKGWGFDLRGKPIEQSKAFPYTTSLDAAVAFVERMLPGCGIELSVASNQVRPVAHAYITQSEEHWTYEGWDNATAKTPARALMAAALRALAQKDQDNG